MGMIMAGQVGGMSAQALRSFAMSAQARSTTGDRSEKSVENCTDRCIGGCAYRTDRRMAVSVFIDSRIRDGGRMEIRMRTEQVRT